MKRFLLFIWKRRLKQRYLSYCKIVQEYNCGSHLAHYISHSANNSRLSVNEAIRKVKALDPSAPIKEIE